jgi:hypothetical protein
MASPYTVSVGAFEGPFDLLLQLIARRKLDVWEVPLSQITDDYLAALQQMRELDLEVTTEFLVIAATLMELKAARLLPDTDDPEAEEAAVEARDLPGAHPTVIASNGAALYDLHDIATIIKSIGMKKGRRTDLLYTRAS